MAKFTSGRVKHSDGPESLPRTPAPSAANAKDGMEIAQERARRYLPDWVDVCAAIALSPSSEAKLHTRFLAGHELSTIAGVIPQSMPALPLHEVANGGREE
jgi:hypothetical protein